MIKLKVLEKFVIQGVAYHPEEVRVVDQEVAEMACSNGWAEDTAGVIPTGKRDILPKKLNVKKAVHNHGSENAG